MKCVECVDYAECSKKHNLTIKRKHCPMAKVERVQTNADRIRAMSDEELAWELIEYNDDRGEYYTHNGCRLTQKEALEAEIEWLKQPAE